MKAAIAGFWVVKCSFSCSCCDVSFECVTTATMAWCQVWGWHWGNIGCLVVGAFVAFGATADVPIFTTSYAMPTGEQSGIQLDGNGRSGRGIVTVVELELEQVS